MLADTFKKKHPKKILAFVHIEKAAGTTLIHLFRRNFFPFYCDAKPLHKNPGRALTARDLRLILKFNPAIKFIGGHSIKPYSDLESFFPDIRYLTVFRDPVKRYVSQYRYWVEKLGHDLSFEKFIEIPTTFNMQSRKISGNSNVEQIKSILNEKFFLTGVVEKFDEFLLLLKNKVKPLKFNPWYHVLNTAKERNPKANSTESLILNYREQIESRNEVDLEMYEYVRHHILPDEIREYGNQFETDLINFREPNQKNPTSILPYLDFIIRKGYYEPAFGLLRKKSGLPFKGSY